MYSEFQKFKYLVFSFLFCFSSQVGFIYSAKYPKPHFASVRYNTAQFSSTECEPLAPVGLDTHGATQNKQNMEEASTKASFCVNKIRLKASSLVTGHRYLISGVCKE